jgi:hypothetical protein
MVALIAGASPGNVSSADFWWLLLQVRDRETERQRDRETERPRDRETERQRDSPPCMACTPGLPALGMPILDLSGSSMTYLVQTLFVPLLLLLLGAMMGQAARR